MKLTRPLDRGVRSAIESLLDDFRRFERDDGEHYFVIDKKGNPLDDFDVMVGLLPETYEADVAKLEEILRADDEALLAAARRTRERFEGEDAHAACRWDGIGTCPECGSEVGGLEA